MKRLLTLLALLVPASAAAQPMAGTATTNIPPNAAAQHVPTMAPPPADTSGPRPRRAVGITTALAVEAAVAANAYCAAMPGKYRVTTLVTDSEAVPIALIGYDNAAQITQRIAFGKANLVIKYRMRSTDAVTRAASDPAFKAELAADPLIVAARPGGNPILMNGALVGSIDVSGTPDGHDDECAMAGLARIQDRLALIAP